ncbi:cytochrome P450 76C2-like [Arachis ipaensis]|uniref:cytochrome P450 76C2-like n=1 Tax=Arachis ipaensis TaxID=130454 RepID=UPI0007AF98DA|nr:cytochrome P450 76C2-like [Arachis ipaensis]
MEILIILFIISFVSAIIPLFLFISSFYNGIQSSKTYYSKLPLPPGPHPYPIIGNILKLFGTNNPLEAITHLSKTYGPIMTLKLASITTIVISSPQIAKEALHKNDALFSGRKLPVITTWSQSLEDFSKTSLVWMPASAAKWRTLRRACATKIFSPQQLDSTQCIRKRKVQDLLNYVHECCIKGEAFDIGEAIFTTIINSMSNTLLSMDLAHYNYFDNNKFHEFKEIMIGLTKETGRTSVSDFLPFLRLLDPQGTRSSTKINFEKMLEFLNSVIEERTHSSSDESRMNFNECNDVLDSFLDLIKQGSSELNLNDVIYLFVDLFIAGIDTTSSTLEWAMAELLHNPEKMFKVKEELHQALGKNGKIEESNISKLPYLNAIVKETLRLHPPAPFLVPHKAIDYVELGGFTVPKHAQILVNVWSMGRDSSIWANPNLFEPERFLDSDIDFKGKSFEYIPFGAGRRICPGLPFASRSIHFILASLLYHFHWKLADEMKPQDMDMNYTFGFTLHKTQPLQVLPQSLVVS